MKVSDETLMRFHDGELDSEQARRVHLGRLVEPEVNARLDAISELGLAVRAWAKVRGIDGAEERRRATRAKARRRALAACAAVTLAALAAPWAALQQRRAGADNAPAPAMRSTRGEPVVASGPVAVETVDFGARSGAIFRVRGEAASETTVVWLPDEPDVAATDSL